MSSSLVSFDGGLTIATVLEIEASHVLATGLFGVDGPFLFPWDCAASAAVELTSIFVNTTPVRKDYEAELKCLIVLILRGSSLQSRAE